MQGSQNKIQPLTPRNIIGRSMTALPPVLSPSSILPPPSSHCVSIPAKKNPACLSEMLFFNLFYLFSLLFKIA